MCRLCLLSPALYIATTVVLQSELGLMTFIICIVSLKLPWPLSPPSFTHISCGGIAPSCQVSPSGELHCITVQKVCTSSAVLHVCFYLCCSISRSLTAAIMFLTYTNGASRISSPPSFEKVKGTISCSRLVSPSAVSANFLCFLSLASETLNVFSHLQWTCIMCIH